MASDLKTYLDKLGAGSPRFGAWFRTDDYSVEVDFGGSYGSPAHRHAGIRVKGTSSSNLTFCAPFNGWAQFASPRRGGITYQAENESLTEVISDPTLRGLRDLNGQPFHHEGYTLLFTCFPAAYLRLKWLFRQLGAGRPVPHRFAVIVEKRDDFKPSEKLNARLKGQGLWSASGEVLKQLKKLNVVGSVPAPLKAPTVDDEWDKGDHVEPTPQYYAPAGAELLAAKQMDVVVFDEHGWPVDPVYVWQAFAKIVEDTSNKPLQEGYQEGDSSGQGKDPLKKHDLCKKLQNKRATLHTVGLHGDAADPYVRRALQMGSDSGYKLDTVSGDAPPPVRRATLRSTSTTGTAEAKKLKVKLAFPQNSKAKGTLGLAPDGTLTEKTLEHTPWDCDFLRLVLVDETRHVARNRPATTSKTAKEAFENVKLRGFKKETVVEPLYDGKQVLGAIDEALEEAASASERRVAWMTPRVDPFLDLDGYRGGRFPLKENVTWSEAHEKNLASFDDRAQVHVARTGAGSTVQLLVVPEKTLPGGAYVRIYPTVIDLDTGKPGRGAGVATFATQAGGCVLPLPRVASNLFFDAVFVARVPKEGTVAPRFQAGFEKRGVPTEPEKTKLDFKKVYLGYDAATGKPFLTLERTCSTAAHYVVVVNPRTGWLFDSGGGNRDQKAGGGNPGTDLKVPLWTESNGKTVPEVTADDTIFVAVKPNKASPLETCTQWHGFSFPTTLQAGALVPVAASSPLARLTATGKGDKAKQLVVRGEPWGRPDADQVAAQVQDQALETRLEKQSVVDSGPHAMARRAESALYLHTKPASGSSDKETERAVLCSAPITAEHGDVKERELGDPQAKPSRAQATLGLALKGRGSHAVYEAFKQRAEFHVKENWDKTFGTSESHSELTPAETAVKESNHRVAFLRTLPKGLDRNAPRADTLSALADAIRQARTSLYIEGPFFELFDRKKRESGKLVYKKDDLNLVQLLHDQLHKHRDLRVIVCIPREIRFGWGDAVDKGWYEARKKAVRTLRYDGHDAPFVTAHQAKPSAAGQPPYYAAATLIHDRAVVFHPMTPEGRLVDLSANVMIVDDAWAMVGDAGLRRRALTFDAGINVGLTDLALEEHAPKLVRNLRITLMKRAIALRERDAVRLVRFGDAFDTVVGLCDRRLSHTVTGYDENWSHVPKATAPTGWREALDPEHYTDVTRVGALIAAIHGPSKTWRAAKLEWKAPPALRDKKGTYTLSVRQKGGDVPYKLSLELKAKADGTSEHTLRFLEEKQAYDVRVACYPSDGKTYRAPGTGWKEVAESAAKLDLGTMEQVRTVRLTWSLPAGAPPYVMSFTVSYRKAGTQQASRSNVYLLPDESGVCRYTLTLPDPAAQYQVNVTGELETLKYAATGWTSVGTSDQVKVGELQKSS
jgi:hypothetical protein